MPRTNKKFYALMQEKGFWFTFNLRSGACLACQPEYVVLSAKKVGKPKKFRRPANGDFAMFFIFKIKDLVTIAPPSANAYFFCGKLTREGDYDVREVQFYRVEVNTVRRVQPE